MKQSKLSILCEGILDDNKVAATVIGLCPALAVTTTAVNGLFMGIATAAVLFLSVMTSSLFKKLIPERAALPCHLVIIATYASIAHMLLKSFAPGISDALGVYLLLTTVTNSIIIDRMQSLSENGSFHRCVPNALFLGVGLIFSLFIIGSIREIFGLAAWFGFPISMAETLDIMKMAAGGLFVMGMLIAGINFVLRNKSVNREV